MEAQRMIKEAQRLTSRIVALNRFMSKVKDKCLPFFKVMKKIFKFKWTLEYKEAFVRLKEYLGQSSLFSKLWSGEDLYLYLAVSNVAINTVLIWEKGGV